VSDKSDERSIGTIISEAHRSVANKATPEQREESLNQGMAVIHGGGAMVPSTAPTQAKDIEGTAENADQMAECKSAMVEWCRGKVADMKQQSTELKEAYDLAVKNKWRTVTLKRHSELALKRVDFYQRMLTALEHGYQIVPSFPVTAFAVRTDKKKPLRMWTTQWNKSHEQEAKFMPAGEGEYKNPFPVVNQLEITPVSATQNQVNQYWASAWKDLEFPISMAKPRIMEATERAMALKIFDDLAILPGYSPSEGTRPPKGDPIIVARLLDPRPRSFYQNQRFVTFIVAWHLNTREL